MPGVGINLTRVTFRVTWGFPFALTISPNSLHLQWKSAWDQRPDAAALALAMARLRGSALTGPAPHFLPALGNIVPENVG